MAITNKLSLTFATQTGSSSTLSFKYANPNVASAKVKALINGIISNGSLWANVPVSAKSAKIVIIDEEKFDID